MKQDSLEKSQSDLKKLRRKSQGKNANKYENKESEVSRMQTCMQMGCVMQHSEALKGWDIQRRSSARSVRFARETIYLYPCLFE